MAQSPNGALRVVPLHYRAVVGKYGVAQVEGFGIMTPSADPGLDPEVVYIESKLCYSSTLHRARVRGYQAGQDVEFQRSNGDWVRGTILSVHGDDQTVLVGYKPCGTVCRKFVYIGRLRRPLNPDLTATVKDLKEPLYVYCSAGESRVDAKTLLAARLGDGQSEESS